MASNDGGRDVEIDVPDAAAAAAATPETENALVQRTMELLRAAREAGTVVEPTAEVVAAVVTILTLEHRQRVGEPHRLRMHSCSLLLVCAVLVVLVCACFAMAVSALARM